MKAQKIKDLHFVTFENSCRLHLPIKAHAILREFSNITRSLNLYLHTHSLDNLLYILTASYMVYMYIIFIELNECQATPAQLALDTLPLIFRLGSG